MNIHFTLLKMVTKYCDLLEIMLKYAIKYIKTIIYIRENITVTKVSFCRNILPNKIYDEFHIKSFFILLS